MLSCSIGPLRHRFPLAPPGRVGGRKGFCSRAIPGPGLSQNPALCGSPPTKCSSALALYWCEGCIPLGGRCCASILPPPRTPALDKEAPAVPCPHCRRSRAGSFRRQRPGSRWNRQPRLCRLHSAVRLRRVYLYLPAIPPHLRRGEPRRKCSGRAGAAVPAAGAENVGRRFRRIVAAKTDSLVGTQSRLRFCPSSTAPVGAVFPGLRPRALGPCRPGPRRPSVPTYCRSLPAAGSLGSPVRCTVQARHSSRADATDRLRGHAPLASLVPRHWWFVDSGPGARCQVLHIFNDITRSTDQAQRLQTTNANYLPTPWRRCG